MVKVVNRSARGLGLKFSLETFNTVRHFSAHTPICYGPNPKNKGSKSWFRYEKYRHAKTVGEALKLGTKIADLCWELQHKNYTLPRAAKTVRARGLSPKEVERIEARLASISGPRGLAVSMDSANAAEELAKEEAWLKAKLELTQKIAKRLGVELESETHTELTEEGVYESADTRNGRLVANHLAQEKLREKTKRGIKLSIEDVSEVLRVWGFAQNCNRLNVLPGGRKWVYSDTLGGIKRRMAGYGVTPATARYPAVPKLLNQWLADNRPAGLKTDFACTSINLNVNYAAKIHRDGNNIGPSAIRAVGDFKGGELYYWSKDDRKTPLDKLQKSQAKKFNIKRKTEIFDGCRAHCVGDFEGERISIVFFSCRGYPKVGAKNIAFLKKECGFEWPTDQKLAAVKKHIEAE